MLGSMRNPLRSMVGRIRSGLQDRALRRFYSQFVRPRDLCFDVGANIGNRTEVFRNLGARVIAIEPQPGCLEALDKAFGQDPEVVIVRKGVAAEPGTLTLSVCDAAPTISTMAPHWKDGRFGGEFEWARTVEVPVTTLDALIEEHGTPVFCKIDVDGFERTVLAGLSRPIPHLSFEFTREFIGEAEACVDRLAGIGAVSVNCSLGESMSLLLPTWVAPQALFQRLAELDDPLLWGDIYVRTT